MNRAPERGVAYDFWLRVQAEQAKRGLNDSELHARSGVSRTTIDRLAKGKRAPQARVVNALAEVLGIDVDEAHQLAGLVPRPAAAGHLRVTVRDAIAADPAYTDDQRETLLRLVDLIEQANAAQHRRAS